MLTIPTNRYVKVVYVHYFRLAMICIFNLCCTKMFGHG